MLAAVENRFSYFMESALHRIDNDPYSPMYTGKALGLTFFGVVLTTIGVALKVILRDKCHGTRETPGPDDLINNGITVARDNFRQAIPMGLVFGCLAYWKWFSH